VNFLLFSATEALKLVTAMFKKDFLLSAPIQDFFESITITQTPITHHPETSFTSAPVTYDI